MKTEKFIQKAVNKYGSLYDYSLVIYKKATTKVKIICAIHGIFEQTPQCHLRGGCKKCSFSKFSESKKIDKDHFINTSRKKHGDRYDYSLVNIKLSTNKVSIVCREHGEFLQIANNHMRGHGCPKCNTEERVDTAEFKKRAFAVHGDRYDYSLCKVSGVRDDVEIICKKHGVFKQKVLVHLKGSGCQECAKTTPFRRSSYIKACENHKGKSIIYLLKCFNDSETFYKIGITCRGVKDRFYGAMPYNYEVLKTYEGKAGLIWDCEKKIFSIFKQKSYVPRIGFAGATECFSEIDFNVFNDCVNGVLNNE